MCCLVITEVRDGILLESQPLKLAVSADKLDVYTLLKDNGELVNTVSGV